MNINATNFKAYVVDDKLRISYFLGRKSKYRDKILNLEVPIKEADKFIEELMRVVWENKIDKDSNN